MSRPEGVVHLRDGGGQPNVHDNDDYRYNDGLDGSLEEQEGPHEVEEEVLRIIPSKMTMNDPRRNWLTPEELERAEEFKYLVESMPDLDDMPDLMYAQYAVILDGDINDKIHRAFALQDFKQEYEIQDTYEEGCRILDTLFELMPEQFLSFSFSDDEGTYVFVHDMTKLDSNNLNTNAKALDWIRACFYVHTTFCPDIESIRKGIVCLAETDGWDWSKKQDFKLFQKFFSELLAVYPFTGQVRYYHTGTVMNIMASMLKQILPKYLRDKFVMGLNFHQRLDKFFLQPNPTIAKQRMLARMKETLKRRYDHERTFSLDNC